MVYSKYFIDSINICQKKKYNINKKYLKYINTPFFKNNNNIKTEEELYLFYKDYILKKEEIKKQQVTDYIKELMSLQTKSSFKNAKDEDKQKQIKELQNFFHIKSGTLEFYQLYLKTAKEFYKYLNLYKQHQFIINIATLYQNYDLYIPNNSDFRGRFYPNGRILHRASGIYKYLLYDSKEFSKINKYENQLQEYIVMNYKPFDKFHINDLYK